jgi:hypothetical protein
MSIEQYKRFKERFETVKPIRGRSQETKPIGDRRRCWETVVKSYVVPNGAMDLEGVECYGAHLYNTDCVLYAPNGDIYMQANGYVTPTTSEFMTRYLPSGLRTYKKYNKLWLDGSRVGGAFVLNHHDRTLLKYDPESHNYTIDNPTKVVQKVVDRTKAKDARSKVKEFKGFVKVMLTLADGWVTDDLMAIHAKRDDWGRGKFEVDGELFNSYNINGRVDKKTAEKLYNAMQTDDDDLKVRMMCMVASTTNPLESRHVRTEQYETVWNGVKRMNDRNIREYRYNPQSVARRIDKIVEYACDIHTTKEVEQGKVMTNLV